MTKQTPERFAKNVLWQLANVQAGVDQLINLKALELSKLTGTSPRQIGADLKRQRIVLQKKIYAALLHESHLD